MSRGFTRVKYIVRRWSLLIVFGLLVILFLKSCQSCSRKQTISFSEIRTEEMRDSLKCEILHRDSIITDLEEEITRLSTELERSEEMIEVLAKDKRQYAQTIGIMSKLAERERENEHKE